ncbi:MAG: transcriptional regulator [Deltaproteobacteria bacterium]|nr:MAG: transcriptional regulator [Deltaproteobacteria bacterium]
MTRNKGSNLLIKFIVLAVAVYLVIQLLKKQIQQALSGGSYRRTGGDAALKAADEMVKDPVCNVYVPKREAIREQVNGKTYYFCSPECRDAFVKN